MKIQNSSSFPPGAEYFADALRYNATLSTLDLRANNIGDDGAALIARSLRVVNEKLEVLDLGFNEIRSVTRLPTQAYDVDCNLQPVSRLCLGPLRACSDPRTSFLM